MPSPTEKRTARISASQPNTRRQRTCSSRRAPVRRSGPGGRGHLHTPPPRHAPGSAVTRVLPRPPPPSRSGCSRGEAEAPAAPLRSAPAGAGELRHPQRNAKRGAGAAQGRGHGCTCTSGRRRQEAGACPRCSSSSDAGPPSRRRGSHSAIPAAERPSTAGPGRPRPSAHLTGSEAAHHFRRSKRAAAGPPPQRQAGPAPATLCRAGRSVPGLSLSLSRSRGTLVATRARRGSAAVSREARPSGARGAQRLWLRGASACPCSEYRVSGLFRAGGGPAIAPEATATR